MAVLFRDDFPGSSLDTGNWSSDAGFGGSISVSSGSVNLNAGSFGPATIISNSAFTRSPLFLTMQVSGYSIGAGGTLMGFLETDITHRVNYDNPHPSATVNGIHVLGHTTGNFSQVGSSASSTASVFGMSMFVCSNGLLNYQIMQNEGTGWLVSSAATAVLTPTHSYNIFVAAGSGTVLDVTWIQLENVIPTMTSGSTNYYVPDITGVSGTSRSTFSPRKTI